jgi:hypothetical protein
MKKYEPASRLKRVMIFIIYRSKLRNYHPRTERRPERRKVERFRRSRSIKDRRREVLREDRRRTWLGSRIRRRNKV